MADRYAFDELSTARLLLRPMTRQDFDVFVETMLTDRKVVEFYYSYRDETNLDSVRQKAEKDFWDHFEESREATPFEIWTIFEQEPATPSGQMGRSPADRIVRQVWRPRAAIHGCESGVRQGLCD